MNHCLVDTCVNLTDDSFIGNEDKIIDNAKKSGDSVGGIFEIFATGLPYGLGSYTQWDLKLQARITALIMSVNAYKGIEIGGGMKGVEKYGSEIHDEIGLKENGIEI